MDFVVSKVAMSICALLVVSVLSGVLGNDILFSKVDELDSILIDLSIVVERSVWSECEGRTSWRVPFLSDGASIDISVRDSVLSAKSGDRFAALRPACDTHTWQWNGTSLNATCVSILDASSPMATSSSGHALEIRTQMVAYEDQNRIFAFVSVYS